MLDVFVIFLLIPIILKDNLRIVNLHSLPFYHAKTLNNLLIYHLLFTIIFSWYILTFGGDSQGYWKFGMEQVKIIDPSWMSYFGQGTTFILWLCYLPSQILGLHYLTGNILFGLLGFQGIRYIYVMVAEFFPTNHKILNIPLFPTLFFFPNLHFWTSGVSKDSVSFWAIAFFLYAIQYYQSKWWQMFIALFFAYMTRPHVGQSLIAAAAFAIIFASEIKFSYKLTLFFLTLFMCIGLSARTLQELKITEYSFEAFDTLAENKIFHLGKTRIGSSVNLNEYSWLTRLFTYLYRPLFYDAHNIFSFFSSFENIINLSMSILIFRNWSIKALQNMPIFLKIAIIAFIPLTLAFMNTLANLGIILRMKNMTMIYFLLFSFYLIAYKKKMKFLSLVEKSKMKL
jgi:hypothetical protein